MRKTTRALTCLLIMVGLFVTCTAMTTADVDKIAQRGSTNPSSPTPLVNDYEDEIHSANGTNYYYHYAANASEEYQILYLANAGTNATVSLYSDSGFTQQISTKTIAAVEFWFFVTRADSGFYAKTVGYGGTYAIEFWTSSPLAVDTPTQITSAESNKEFRFWADLEAGHTYNVSVVGSSGSYVDDIDAYYSASETFSTSWFAFDINEYWTGEDAANGEWSWDKGEADVSDAYLFEIQVDIGTYTVTLTDLGEEDEAKISGAPVLVMGASAVAVLVLIYARKRKGTAS